MTSDQPGFVLLREQPLPELNSRARLYRHAATGAPLLALLNDDRNKTFGVAFRTLPDDHTGVAHILEHCVLGGSRKYPVKEPFVELMKGSLATFLNAFTYPDMTCYPFASQNLQDFFNLLDVYLDAVFHPRLTRPTLEQEGWHFELESAAAPLAYRGIVFNEMKGSYSNPEYAGLVAGVHTLLPDTVYARHSGGHPRHIPELTYEAFKRFYDAHYHPSNARFFLYGDLPVDEALGRIDDYLRAFTAAPTPDGTTRQPKFAAPRAVTAPFIAGADGAERQFRVMVNWLLDENTDPATTLALDILNEILLGSPASPLRKALLDSGLGEALTGLPAGDHGRQLHFSAGLKGVAEAAAAQVEPLILNTLETLARAGLDPEMIEAAVNTVEFALRENNAFQGQRGVILMLRALQTWLHGGDPLAPLAFEAPLAAVKARLAADPRFFEGLIRAWLLDNPHRVTLTLRPDPGLREREEADERARLAQAEAALTPAEREAIAANTRRLRELQAAPNTPEALATLPFLKLSDLDKSAATVPQALHTLGGTRLLIHPLATNGLIYLDLGFDLRALPQDLLPYAYLFGRALVEMGTRTQSDVKLAQRIGRLTGGLWPEVFASPALRPEAPGPVWLFLRGKATAARAPDLLALWADILREARLDDADRFRRIVLEEKARREAGLIQLGSRYANRRLRAHFTEADWANDQINFLGGLFFVRQVAERMTRDWPTVLAALEAVRAALLNRSALLVHATLEPAHQPALVAALTPFLDALPEAPYTPHRWSPPAPPAREAFAIPGQVNYVGQAAPIYSDGRRRRGSALAVVNTLNTTWLWDKVRAQGGAYGGFATLDTLSGVFSYLSYRDPNLTKTLENYAGAGAFLRDLKLSDGELTKAILGAVGELDAYALPDARGYTALARYLTGEDDAARQQLRDELLATSPADFTAFADQLDAVQRDGHLVIFGPETALRAADEQAQLGLAISALL